MNLFLVAWRAARWLPVWALRAAAGTVAIVAWLTSAKPVRRLEDNLRRVTGREGRALRRLSRRAMASTARYYAETLELGRMAPATIDARVRVEDLDHALAAMREDTGTVAVLTHSGNWDLIGAYACRHIIHVTAVAEVLRPREAFDEFVALRERVGMRILGHEGGATFRSLISHVKSERTLACLVADRDLSGSGIPVQMWGHTVTVAPGPAALSRATGAALLPVFVRYERLRGRRARAAKSRWGSVLAFGPILNPRDFDGEDAVAAMTQAWATAAADAISTRPEDWHMLQRFGWVEPA